MAYPDAVYIGSPLIRTEGNAISTATLEPAPACGQIPDTVPHDVGDVARFRNFSRNLGPGGYVTPDRAYTPRSVEELVSIVREAERQVPRAHVRARGSGWSMSGIMIPERQGTEGFLVNTDRLNKTLSETMTGFDYSPGAPSFQPGFVEPTFYVQDGPDTVKINGTLFRPGDPIFGALSPAAKERKLYHVEAGIKIQRLYQILEYPWSTSPYAPKKAAPDTMQHHGYALPTMGGAGGQSLAGAISTSTHGSDFDRRPISDMVQGIRIVGAGGAQFFIQKGGHNAIVDVDKLQQIMPCVSGCGQIVSDDDAFNAVLVSMGRMGIIYSFVLEVVPQYFLRQKLTQSTWNTVKKDAVGGGSPLDERLRKGLPLVPDPTAEDIGPHARYVQVTLVPYANSDGDYTC